MQSSNQNNGEGKATSSQGQSSTLIKETKITKVR
jgi:hypothetical protein